MGKKGRVLPFVRPVSHGATDDAVGPGPGSPRSGGSQAQPLAGGQPSRPPAPPLPKRIPGSARPMPGKGQPRRVPRPEAPLPAVASQPDPDRVIEPETSRPQPPGEPVAGSGAPRPEPSAEPVTGPMALRPDSLVKPSPAQPARPSRALQPARSAQPPRPVALRAGSEVTPSWSSVVATTVRLWVERRRARWRVAAALAVAVVVFVAGGLTVALLRNAGAKSAARNGGATSGSPGLGRVQAASTARQQAAAWVAAQVSHSAVVSCDPAMCAALQAKGFPAGDLMTLGPAASDPLGSAVIVATAAIRSQFGSRLTSVYAPTVIASFGSGSAGIQVRAYAAGGAAQYLTALRADELSRRNDGSQLLRNSRVSAAPAARQQLAAGQVDTRLLITIVTLAGQGPVSILAFGDSAPGASPGVPLRLAELATPPGAKSGYLQSVVALLRVQQEPYQANSVTLVRLANGQKVVRIEFAAPSPLGLLSG
jgi:hypothetical protein